MRRRGRGGDEEGTESPFPAKERPLLPHAVVEHDGVVAVLPARDGARNVFATLAATGLLDASAESLPCLRLASGRVLQRFRDVVSEAFQMGIDRVLLVNWDESMWRTRNRLVRTVTGAIEAMSSVEELFACRADGRWRIFLRMRPGSFGESLLDVAANRPLAELLVDVPQDVAFVAGSLAPAVVAELPERLARSRDGFLRRVRVESGPPSRPARGARPTTSRSTRRPRRRRAPPPSSPAGRAASGVPAHSTDRRSPRRVAARISTSRPTRSGRRRSPSSSSAQATAR
jgi:hypothetical protein